MTVNGIKNTIQGIPRHQMQFTSMDGFVIADNPIRIIDAFVEKLDLGNLGISHCKTAINVNEESRPRW